MLDDEECPALISAKVPVTILTGFLGSGKTTLLHYVLTAEHQLRIAVIVNEFEFGKTIEKGLTLKSSQKDDDEWVELKNGCMCCSAQSQTVAALENLIQTKGTFDLILVETAGLADPGPVAALFWQDEALCGNLFLSGIIAVVDAVNIFRYIHDNDVHREATRQILVADKILLNKCDLVEKQEQEKVHLVLEELNPSAEIINTQFSQPPNLRSVLFMNTTRSLPTFLTDHLHNSCEVAANVETNHTLPEAPCRTSKSGNITAVSMEFFSSLTTLAARSTKEIEEIAKKILYPESFDVVGEITKKRDHLDNHYCRSSQNKDSLPFSDHSGHESRLTHQDSKKGTQEESLLSNTEPLFEVIRCKAAIWVHQPSSPPSVTPGATIQHPSTPVSSSLTNSSSSSGSYRLYQLQCIGELFDITPMEGVSVPFGCSRALVLGRHLSEEILRHIFLMHLVPTP